MRIKLLYIILIGIVLAQPACVKVGQVMLDQDNLLHLDDYVNNDLNQTSKVKNVQDTIIADFSKDGISKWWGASNIFITKSKGKLVADAIAVGLEYDRFGYNFSVPKDFTKYNVIRIKARAEGKRIPLLRIDLKDDQGLSTNHLEAKLHILSCDKFSYYYFKYDGRFEQGWPYKANVNSSKISQMEFFINPGGLSYTGRIYIEEIVMLKGIENKQENSNECIVDINENFKNGKNYWWVNSNKYDFLFSDIKKELRIKVSGAGNNYESFGRIFSPTDLNMNNSIKITAKASGSSAPDLRLDLLDADGYTTNGNAIIKSIPNDNIYRDYYFDFEDKFYQGWPQIKPLNVHSINEFMFFINPGGSVFWGDVFISKIELVKKDTYKLNSSSSVTTLDTLSLFSSEEQKETWWASSSDVKLYQEKENIIIQPKEGKNITGKIGYGFDNIDLSNKTKFIIKGSPDNGTVSKFSLIFIDTKGKETSPMPAIDKTQNGDYIFNIDKSTPINYNEISGIVIYIDEANGFNGRIQINDILVQ